jgi:predicted phosphodiesterase
MKFDIFSDVHLNEIENLNIKKLVQHILPETPSDLLIFAGDFGYDNVQNIEFLKELKKTYKTILFVLGNNDSKIYPDSNSPYKSSKERVEAFLSEVGKLDNVIYLDHPVKINGITFGGSDIFFDFDDLKNRFGMEDDEIYDLWKKKELNLKHKGFITDPKVYTEHEKRHLAAMIQNIDVLITHGPPHFLPSSNDHEEGFFRFDATFLEDKLKGKVWVYGHKHGRYYGELHGCLFYNPSFFRSESPVFDNKILTIEI